MQPIGYYGDPKDLEKMQENIDKYGIENVILNLSRDNIKHNINIGGISNRRDNIDF